MKRPVLLFCICFILAFFTVLQFTNRKNTPSLSQGQNTETKATPRPQPEAEKTIIFQKVPYRYEIIGPIETSRVSLHSNLPAKQTSQQLKAEFSCTAITSAGFYNTENQHIGLFLVNETVIQEQSKNALFNQYVWSTKNGSAGIGQMLPDQPLVFALQTGPLLIANSIPQQLRLRADEEARRIAVGIDTEKALHFYAVTQQGNDFTGPRLEDLPFILEQINNQEQRAVETVVNLDGGNHSTFQTDLVTIQEFSPVGGIFCIR